MRIEPQTFIISLFGKPSINIYNIVVHVEVLSQLKKIVNQFSKN